MRASCSVNLRRLRLACESLEPRLLLQGDTSSFRLFDQQSEVYYEIGVSADEKIDVDKKTEITGNLYSNDDVKLDKDSLVTGNVSAVERADIKGTVVGEIREGVDPMPLPALPDTAELRALADRVFEHDTTFEDATVNDIVLVDGKAKIEGSLNGVGTIIATKDITLKKGDKLELSALTLSLAYDFRTDTQYELRVTVRDEKGKKLIDEETARFDGSALPGDVIDESPGNKKEGNLTVDSVLPDEVRFSVAVEPTDALQKEIQIEVTINDQRFGPENLVTEGADVPDEGTMVGDFEVVSVRGKADKGFESVSLATDFAFVPGAEYIVSASLRDGKGKKLFDTEIVRFLGTDLPVEMIDADPGSKEGNLRIDSISAFDVQLTIEATDKDKLGNDYQIQLDINDTSLRERVETGDKADLEIGQQIGPYTVSGLVRPGEHRPLLPTTKISLLSLRDIDIDSERRFRGVVRAAGDVKLDKDVRFEGVIVAGHKVDIKKETQISFIDFDTVAPEISSIIPADGSVLPTDVPTIEASFRDDFSGVDAKSVRLRLDGVDRTVEAVIDQSGLSFTPAAALSDGLHTAVITIQDYSDNETQAVVNFTTLVNTAEVTIAANDASAAEPNDDGQFTVSMTNPSATATVISYTVSGDATPGRDYTALVGNVTISAGATAATIDVSILDENLLEDNETVVVTLDSIPSGDADISIGAANTATVTIADDDTAEVSIAANDASAAEPNDDGQFTVSMTNPSATDTVISYTVSGDATPGRDYTALSGKVTISAGATAATIDVRVLDDGLPEGEETVVLTLQTVTSGDADVSIGADSRATVTITDNDVVVPVEGEWTAQGPAPALEGQVFALPNNEVAGGIHVIAAHPTDANTVYIGANNGGIWKTTNANDASPTWTPLTDTLPSQSIGAMEFDPTDGTHQTVIAGTGRFSNFERLGDDETGLYHTVDGGATWNRMDAPLLLSRRFSGVSARGHTLVAAAVDVSGSGGGVFRSTDIGMTWTTISGQIGSGLPAGGVSDLVGDPGNPDRLYAAVTTRGIFRSDDGGATWVDVTGTVSGISGATNNLQMAVHDSPAGNRIYVAVVNSSVLSGVYFSDDQGGSWTQMDTPVVHNSPKGNPNTTIAADPTDRDLVYLGGDRTNIAPFTGLIVRGDASLAPTTQFTTIVDQNANDTAPHADSRALAFDANHRLLQSDDGGIYRHSNPQGTGSWDSVNGNLQVMEVHDVSYDPISNTLLIGSHDNGTQAQRLLPGTPPRQEWDMILGGDGGDVAIDSVSLAGSNQTLRYASSQYLGHGGSVSSPGNLFRFTFDASGNLVASRFIDTAAISDPQFVTPIELNTIDPNRMLFGGLTKLYESLNITDRYPRITGISGSPGANRNAMVYGGKPGGVANPDLIYVANGAQVHVRTTLGGGFTATSPPGAGTIRDVAADPDESNSVFAVDSDHVFMSTNAGAAWTDITGNLTTISSTDFRTIEYIPGTAHDAIVVGGRSGTFASISTSFAAWSQFGNRLPDVLVFDLEYDSTDDVLVAGTLGRGAWTLANVNGLFHSTVVAEAHGRQIPDAPLTLDSSNPGDTDGVFRPTTRSDPAPGNDDTAYSGSFTRKAGATTSVTVDRTVLDASPRKDNETTRGTQDRVTWENAGLQADWLRFQFLL